MPALGLQKQVCLQPSHHIVHDACHTCLSHSRCTALMYCPCLCSFTTICWQHTYMPGVTQDYLPNVLPLCPAAGPHAEALPAAHRQQQQWGSSQGTRSSPARPGPGPAAAAELPSVTVQRLLGRRPAPAAGNAAFFRAMAACVCLHSARTTAEPAHIATGCAAHAVQLSSGPHQPREPVAAAAWRPAAAPRLQAAANRQSQAPGAAVPQPAGSTAAAYCSQQQPSRASWLGHDAGQHWQPSCTPAAPAAAGSATLATAAARMAARRPALSRCTLPQQPARRPPPLSATPSST
jgi:hypothetical protein